MNKLTIGFAVRIWWAFLWRSLVITAVLGLVVFKPITAGLTMRGSEELIPIINVMYSLVAVIPGNIASVFWTIRRAKFSGRHLGLVSESQPINATEADTSGQPG